MGLDRWDGFWFLQGLVVAQLLVIVMVVVCLDSPTHFHESKYFIYYFFQHFACLLESIYSPLFRLPFSNSPYCSLSTLSSRSFHPFWIYSCFLFLSTLSFQPFMKLIFLSFSFSSAISFPFPAGQLFLLLFPSSEAQ